MRTIAARQSQWRSLHLGNQDAAALSGLGVAPLPCFMAAEAIAAGQLVPILPGWKVEPIPLYIVYPPNRHLSNKVRVFVDWTVRILARTPLTAPAHKASD